MKFSILLFSILLSSGSPVINRNSAPIKRMQGVAGGGKATFKYCNGEADSDELYVPQDPTFEPYTFDGWYTKQTGGTKVNTFTTSETYYAHYLHNDKPVMTEGLTYSVETETFTAANTGELDAQTLSAYGLSASKNGGEYILSFDNFTMDLNSLFQSTLVNNTMVAFEVNTYRSDVTCKFSGTNTINAADENSVVANSKNDTYSCAYVLEFWHEGRKPNPEAYPTIKFQGEDKENDKLLIDGSGFTAKSKGAGINIEGQYGKKQSGKNLVDDHETTYGNNCEVVNLDLDIVAPHVKFGSEYGFNVMGKKDTAPTQTENLTHLFLTNSKIKIRSVSIEEDGKIFGIHTDSIRIHIKSCEINLFTEAFSTVVLPYPGHTIHYYGLRTDYFAPYSPTTSNTWYDERIPGLLDNRGIQSDATVINNPEILYIKDSTINITANIQINGAPEICGIFHFGYVIMDNSKVIFADNSNCMNPDGMKIGYGEYNQPSPLQSTGLFILGGSSISFTNANLNLSPTGTVHLYDGKIELFVTDELGYRVGTVGGGDRNSNPILHRAVTEYLSIVGGKYIISNSYPNNFEEYYTYDKYLLITRGPQLTVTQLPDVPEEISYNGEDIDVEILEVEPGYFDDEMELTIQYKKGSSPSASFTEEAPSGISGTYSNTTHRVSLHIGEDVESDNYEFRVTNGLLEDDPAFVNTDSINMRINGKPAAPIANTDVVYVDIAYQPLLLILIIIGLFVLYGFVTGIYKDKKNDDYEENNMKTTKTKMIALPVLASLRVFKPSQIAFSGFLLAVIVCVIILVLIEVFKIISLKFKSNKKFNDAMGKINKAGSGAKNATSVALSKIYELIPFQKRIHSADPDLQDAFNEIKTEAMCYGLTSSISKSGDLFSASKKQYFKITIAGKHLKLYYALDPIEYSKNGLSVGDASGVIAHSDTPLVYKVQSKLSVKRAKLLLADVAKKASLKRKEVAKKDWVKEIPIPEKTKTVKK